jgi:hypothetical protein
MSARGDGLTQVNAPADERPTESLSSGPIASACRKNRDRLQVQGWTVGEAPDHGHDVIGQAELVPPLLTDLPDGAVGA